METAKKAFIEKGFVHTSMQDIMDKVGILRGTLYSNFDNIEHVFLEVLKYDDQKDIQYFGPSDKVSVWLQLKNWIEEQRLYIERIDQRLLYVGRYSLNHSEQKFYSHKAIVKKKFKEVEVTFGKELSDQFPNWVQTGCEW